MTTFFTRRHVLTAGGRVLCGAALATALGGGQALLHPSFANTLSMKLGTLAPPDANGLRLPAGFSSKIIARSGMAVQRGDGKSSGYRWHIFPDGGATFAQPDGGWIYVSNSEASADAGGGAGAVRFAHTGDIVAAYRILGNTNVNCAGGPTPWGTWLSCEEITYGFVYECDPTGATPARQHRALGAFQHEAVAVDPVHRQLYLTEDEPDGRLYRFTPASYPGLAAGTLEVAVVEPISNVVSWRNLPRPDPTTAILGTRTATRYQVKDSTIFRGGEGIWYHDGTVFFTTKRDNRVWALDTGTQVLRVVYDAATNANPVLRGVDNIVVSAGGRIVVAEDNGDMQLVALDPQGNAAVLLQVEQQEHSEITGPAFDPAGVRLYFSSQRGPRRSRDSLGITYEISGPFNELLAI